MKHACHFCSLNLNSYYGDIKICCIQIHRMCFSNIFSYKNCPNCGKEIDILDEKDSNALDLQKKNLFKVPKELEIVPLKSIDLSDNHILKINNLSECIEFLFINNNRITTLENIPPKCISVSAEYNQIMKIAPLPKSLKQLNLFGNPIHHIICDWDTDIVVWHSRFKIDTLPILKKILIDDICGIIAEYFELQTTTLYDCCKHIKKFTLEEISQLLSQ